MRGDKDINIKFIDSKYQRYPTCGDYWETDNSVEIRITKQRNLDYHLTILLHEMIEYMLTEKRGLTEAEILKYDIEWNRLEQLGLTTADEPGNEPGCCYSIEHRIAENYERQLAIQLGIDWATYEKNLII